MLCHIFRIQIHIYSINEGYENILTKYFIFYTNIKNTPFLQLYLKNTYLQIEYYFFDICTYTLIWMSIVDNCHLHFFKYIFAISTLCARASQQIFWIFFFDDFFFSIKEVVFNAKVNHFYINYMVYWRFSWDMIFYEFLLIYLEIKINYWNLCINHKGFINMRILSIRVGLVCGIKFVV